MKGIVIDHIDDKCIITKNGDYYERCITATGHNSLMCNYVIKDIVHMFRSRGFVNNGIYEEYTVNRISSKNLNNTQKEKIARVLI